jgi:hypothetical protein
MTGVTFSRMFESRLGYQPSKVDGRMGPSQERETELEPFAGYRLNWLEIRRKSG